MLQGPLDKKYDAIYSLDVFEHIPSDLEDKFIGNIHKSLKKNSVLIIGIPSLESLEYASPASKEGHINCKTGRDFKQLMSKYFENVFLFSMNDEIVHTGFEKMAHYLFTISCGKKE